MFGLSWAFFIGLSLWALEACHQYEKTEKGGKICFLCVASPLSSLFLCLCHSSLSGVDSVYLLYLVLRKMSSCIYCMSTAGCHLESKEENNLLERKTL